VEGGSIIRVKTDGFRVVRNGVFIIAFFVVCITAPEEGILIIRVKPDSFRVFSNGLVIVACSAITFRPVEMFFRFCNTFFRFFSAFFRFCFFSTFFRFFFLINRSSRLSAGL
jgi:hypothetical protein